MYVTSAPAVLQPVSAEAGGGAAHAWLSMDVGCLLRYEAVVARVGTNNEVEDVSGSFGVVLGSLDNRLQKIVLLGPSVGHVVSSTFEYNIVSRPPWVQLCSLIFCAHQTR